MLNQNANYMPSFAPVTMTMVRVIVTMELSGMSTFLSIYSFTNSIDVKLVFAIKRSQTKPLSPDYVFFFGGGGIFDVVIFDFTIGKAVILQFLLYYYRQYK